MRGWDRGLTMKIGASGLGVFGLLNLAGCGGSGGPDVVETTQQKEARLQFGKTLAALEGEMKSPQSGNGEQQAERLARKLVDAARSYSKTSGKNLAGATRDLRGLLQEHPALTLTTVLALGEVTASGLDRLGLTDTSQMTLDRLDQAVRDHPMIATGLATGAATGMSYLVMQVAQLDRLLPAKPTGAAATRLDQTFSHLEQRLTNQRQPDTKAISSQAMAAVSRYQKETGRPWDEVSLDVKAVAADHPALAAQMVASSGVAAQTVLENAGLDPKVAALVGKALQTPGGASRLVEFIRSHPLLGGAVAVSVAAGAGTVVTPAPTLPAGEQGVAAALDQILQGSPLGGQGLGAHFVAAGKQYNVDPYALVAISKHETGFGSLGVGVRKHMGVGAWDKDPNAITPYDGALPQIYYGAKTFANLRHKGGSEFGAAMPAQLLAVNRAGWASDANWHLGVGRAYARLAPG